MLIIFFGEMGCGKDYAKDLFHKAIGIDNHKIHIHKRDADKFIRTTDNMQSNSGVDRFVKEALIPGIREDLRTNKNVLLSYAFYNESHRNLVWTTFTKEGHEVHFVHIKCSRAVQTANLIKRPKGYVFWLPFSYISHSMAWEVPKLKHEVIEHNNDGEALLLEKMKRLPFCHSSQTVAREEKKESKEVAPIVDQKSFYARHPFFTAAVVVGGVALLASQTKVADTFQRGMNF